MLLLWNSFSQVFALENNTVKNDIIKVGYTDHGMMIHEENGHFDGYGVEYLQMLSAYTGWKYEFIAVTEENRISSLLDGTIDLLCDLSESLISMEEVLASEEQSGLYYGLLCAKENDDRFFFEEIESLNGVRIAVNKSHNMQELLDEYAKDNHFSYIPVYCNSFSELEIAIKEGQADLILASNQRELSGYKIIAKAGVRKQYFAVAKNNRTLIRQLDSADRKLKLKQPFIESFLYEKYYGRPIDVLTGTTRQEYDLINSGNSVMVVCDAGSYPVEYLDRETGEYKGIYADAMKLIADESGLQFQFVPIEDYKNAWEMLRNGEAEMAAGMYVDDSLAKEYDLHYSNAYLNANYTMIAKEDNSLDSIFRIALPENYVGILSYVANNYPEWEVIQGENVEECLKMVADGKAEGTLVNSVFLQTAYNINNYKGLAVFPMHSVEIPIRCTFAGDRAQILCQIVNKAINRIPEDHFKNCTIENSVNISYKPNFRDILRESFPFVIGVFLIVFAIYLFGLRLREKYYRNMAMTDSVTGLWNGICFREKAKEEILRNYATDYQLISMDMEHFKYVNNDFGVKAADNMLVIIADRIRMIFGNEALYAREMGDFFLILTKKREDIEAQLMSLSEEIIFQINGVRQQYKPIFKFGICTITITGKDFEIGTYIDASVLARKTIKRDHRKQIAYYNDYMEAEAKAEVRIEKKMENALRNREFIVYYQPKYLLETEEIIGAEALVRWNDPDEGLISPGAFIPIFERNGFIIQLDFFVFEEVIRLLSERLTAGKKLIPISVNVSRIHIATGDFLKKLITLTEQYGVDRSLIELELTETVFGGKHQNTIEFIKACKSAGFKISIDDFGSGYSSLNLLKEIPVDVLKIDREFLNELEESDKSRIIIEQVVEMATKINIQTLCEGVETKKQAEFLKQIDCNMVQGYLYSRPIPLERFEILLENSG